MNVIVTAEAPFNISGTACMQNKGVKQYKTCIKSVVSIENWELSCYLIQELSPKQHIRACVVADLILLMELKVTKCFTELQKTASTWLILK